MQSPAPPSAWAGVFSNPAHIGPLGVGLATPSDAPGYCPPISNMVTMTTNRTYFTPDLTAASFYAPNCSSQKNGFPANIYSWHTFTVLQFTKTILVIGTTNYYEALYNIHLFRLTYGQLPMPVYAQYCPVSETWAEPGPLAVGRTLFSMLPSGGQRAPDLEDPYPEPEDPPPFLLGKRAGPDVALTGDERIWRSRKKRQRRARRDAPVPAADGHPGDLSAIGTAGPGPPCYDESPGAPFHRKRHVQIVIGQAPCLPEIAISGKFSVRNIVAVGRVCEEGLRLDPMCEAWQGKKSYRPGSFPGLKLKIPIYPGARTELTANIFTTGHCLLMGKGTPDEVARIFWDIKLHARPFADGTVPMNGAARNADRRHRHEEFISSDTLLLDDQDAADVERYTNLITADMESSVMRDVSMDYVDLLEVGGWNRR